MARILCILLLSLPLALTAQRLTGVSTRYSDSFREWTIYTDQDGEAGELTLRWPEPEQWGDWSYRVGEQSGRIRLKWPNRLDEWEVRGGNEVATARALWRNDPRDWQLSGRLQSARWRSFYGNSREEWQLSGGNQGNFAMYTAYEGDPRDWVIVDELSEEITLPEKLLMVLVSLYVSTPKV